LQTVSEHHCFFYKAATVLAVCSMAFHPVAFVMIQGQILPDRPLSCLHDLLDVRLPAASVCCLQEAEGGALASYTGTLRYSSGLIADQKRTAAALVRVSKMMGKVRRSLPGSVDWPTAAVQWQNQSSGQVSWLAPACLHGCMREWPMLCCELRDCMVQNRSSLPDVLLWCPLLLLRAGDWARGAGAGNAA
jgi:hypothetical protein